jgi:adenylate cyclase
MLTAIATQHERRALEQEIESRARMQATYLAGTAAYALAAAGSGAFDEELTLEYLVGKVGVGKGVVAARLLDRDGVISASVVKGERGEPGVGLTDPDDPASAVHSVRKDSLLLVAAPVYYSDVRVGEAQVVLDLRILVDPLVRSTTRQLAMVAGAVLLIGVAAGLGFVALLVGPLQRLRRGVERLTHGDVTVRVAPTSRDEVGELTRAFNEMGDALEQKQRIQSAFGRYVDDYVLNQLLEGPEHEQLAGIQRDVTVLFADVRRFTRLSEGMKAPAVVSLLNDVFQLVSDRILERGGTIDKYIGDSVMAYFGAPVPHADHAQRAVLAALDIQRAVRERARRIRDQQLEGVPADIGVGIHTGTVVVGNIGSDRRTDFTAIGDAVNVAHRLEKLAKPGEILVSEAVQRQVRTVARLHFEGERHLSGREEPVHVYSVEVGDSPEGGTQASAA